MVSGKYTSDYRLENVEKRGRLVTQAVYRGDWYEFAASDDDIRRLKLLYSICSLTSVLSYVGALFFNTASMHCFYVMIPFAVMVFPLFYQAASLRRLLTAKGKVTREHKDKTGQRFTSSALFTMVFSALSVVGHIVFIILNGDDVQGVFYLILTAVILTCAILEFKNRNGLEMVQTGTAKLIEEDAE